MEREKGTARAAVLLIGVLSAIALAGCGDDGAGLDSGISVQVLVSGLKYPKGLWPKGETVYFTETAGRNSSYGGKVRLDAYDLPGGVMRVVTDDPVNAEAVVAASSSLVYLASFDGSIPGDAGRVSWVNPQSGVETHLLDIEIAATDMHIDEMDNIRIIGSSDRVDARSLLFLPAGGYLSPILLKAGLGRIASVAKAGESIYYSGPLGTYRIAANGAAGKLLDRSFASMSCSSGILYYADPARGTIGAFGLARKTDRALLSGLAHPIAVRWDAEKKRLYFLEAGTDANRYKDGALGVVYGLE